MKAKFAIGAMTATAAVAAIAVAAAGVGTGTGRAAAAAPKAAASTVAASTLVAQAPVRPGAGWAVATWSRTEDSPGTLYLIDPAGRRRAVATVPAHAQPLLWSPDGERVQVTSDTGDLTVTLRTGHTARQRLPESARAVAYSHPRGLAVLAAVDTEVHDGTGDYLVTRLERFGLDGRHQQDYPRTVRGAGQLDTTSVIENRAGTELVVGARRGLVLLRNDGTVVRRLLASKRDCTVSSWWHRDVALASCNGTLWAVPTPGAKVERVSAAPSSPNIFGYATAWRYGKGSLGLAPNGCGPQSLVRFRANGTGDRVTVPQPIAKPGRPTYVGHGGNRVLMTVSPGAGCMSGPTTLFAYDAVTHRSTALLGPAVNGGTVQGAIAYPVD